MKKSSPAKDSSRDQASKARPGQKRQDGGEPSDAPEEGNGAAKSSSVKLAENRKTDESGAVLD
jgi:hypothetical protein